MLMSMTLIASTLAHGAVTKAAFGKMPDGKAVDVYTITSPEIEVKVATCGARVVSLKTKDRDGKMADVVLGYTSAEGYSAEGATKTYFGSVVGRYGNRIRNGKFTLEGKTFQVPPNNNGNALHGGPHGFDDQLWTATPLADGVELTLVSKDGDMGFPGNLTLHTRYTVHGNALHIDYTATTDKPTVVNVTNHSYFNLSGQGSGPILNEEIMINAAQYTPIDAGLIPVGGPQPVAGTPFDFNKPTAIGARINDRNDQLKLAGGYDHNWILNGKNGEMKLAAKVYDPRSGRVLTVTTTEPGVQFYSGNFLDGSFKSPSGAPYAKYAGLCLETQHFPDSPNQPAFPSTELKPGQTMKSSTVFTFTAQK